MERGHEEQETQEFPRRGAWQARWLGAQRGQAPRQPRKWPQGWSGHASGKRYEMNGEAGSADSTLREAFQHRRKRPRSLPLS
jgi:hypothetical protein